jgi:signal transduction histidine kinase
VPGLEARIAVVASEACKNLVVNAFRYGAPPVVLTVTGGADVASIAIRDRGAGFHEADWADAAVRFTRQSGVSPTSAGLGLSIVDAVARAHWGQLRFGRTSGGDFEASIVLPSVGGRPS